MKSIVWRLSLFASQFLTTLLPSFDNKAHQTKTWRLSYLHQMGLQFQCNFIKNVKDLSREECQGFEYTSPQDHLETWVQGWDVLVGL